MAKKSTSHKIVRNLLLKPLSALYGVVTSTRNKMFECGVLSQREFDIPILVVGNIAVGGTGKTPHTEYLIKLLRTRYNIGVLSRGYNRRTKGFRLATDQSNAAQIGDEPYQIFRKFGDKGVMVAVCEDRCHGIDRMREINPDLNLILLDDAFQHRYVKPTASIVLTEYSRPVFSDSMLPAGRLREGMSALQRADIVVVTKCPTGMKQLEYRLFDRDMNLYPYQRLFFSRYVYGEPVPVFPDVATERPSLSNMTEDDIIVALAGIANPKPFVKHLRTSKARIRGLLYADHHNFNKNDLVELINKIKTSGNPARTLVMTTEKDAMRLRGMANLPKGLKRRLFYIPISVKFITNSINGPQPAGQQFAEAVMKILENKNKI